MKNDKDKTPNNLFGAECGTGWWPLCQKAVNLVNEWNEKHTDGLDTWGGEKLEIIQMKEKFGELNIYLNFYPDSIFNELMELAKESRGICERCGSKNGVETKKLHGWIYTLCPECQQKEINRWNELNK